MQLRLDAADRLVELVEERRGPVYAEEAARRLFALRHVPAGMARSLLEDAVAADARLAWSGDSVRLATPPGHDLPLERATYVVVDLETTGLRPGTCRICEIGAVRVRELELGESFQTLANPGMALARAVASLTGLRDRELRRAPPAAEAVRRGLAQERGATSVADLCELASTRTRRIYLKRSLAFGAPTTPGVYLFRDQYDQVLYVGRARDLRARLRSYFRTDRQRPAVEAALGALERIEWRERGSELEAALQELRLIRELRPPANARVTRPDRYVWLRRRGDVLVCSRQPTELGPLRSRSRARLAARALAGASEWELADPALALPRLRAKVRERAEVLRYEDAARLRDRVQALERVVAELRRVRALRRAACCLVGPALEPGFARAVFVAGGRVATVRSLPPGLGARLEVEAGLAACRLAEPSTRPEDVDELLLVGTFLRRPPPELRVCPLDARAILDAATRAAAQGPAPARPDRRPARPRAA